MEKTTQSSTKRQKVSDGKQNNFPSVDRLSALPDVVVCHILSFLPTKISVSSSILARRWKFLWAHVPTLHFEGKVDSDVIHRIMLLHKVKNMDTFRLCHLHYICNEYQLETWISTVIERNIRNIDLRLGTTTPRCLFTCKTLVDLRVNLCTFPPSSGAVSLPSLKKLYLYDAEYNADEALPHLLSGCPVLEELILMKGTIDRFLRRLSISSPTIKRLTVNFPCSRYDFCNPEYKVVINAPALMYLNVIDCSYEHISISPMASLIEADVCLNNDSVQHNYWSSFSIERLFSCFHSVKFLKFAGQYKENEFISTRLDNLTKLELAADWRFLTKFLENADNLEVLIIREIPEHWQNWKEPVEELRACVLNSLKTVTIHEFSYTEQEFDMVRFILTNAQVLKRMGIYLGSRGVSLEAKFDALKKIPLFQRGSTECEVAFL
ncbi:hypothetical protein OROHE_012549 [Orobanche hederae]